MTKKTKYDPLMDRVERLEEKYEAHDKRIARMERVLSVVIPAVHRTPRTFTLDEFEEIADFLKAIVMESNP